jgi:hypothetical protein
LQTAATQRFGLGELMSLRPQVRRDEALFEAAR